MEKTKQQFGKAVIDGKEKKYCQISLVVDDDEAINRISLTGRSTYNEVNRSTIFLYK